MKNWFSNHPDLGKKRYWENQTLNKSRSIEYYNKNKTEIRKKYRERYKNDPLFRKSTLESNKKSRKTNIIKKRICNSKYKKRHRKNPAFKLKCNASKSIWQYLKKEGGFKKNSCWKELPYKPIELKVHLESLWESWMNWENYGTASSYKRTWNIDHIIPQSKLPYDSLDHPNFLKCWALENLRPFDSVKNSIKGNKYEQ